MTHEYKPSMEKAEEDPAPAVFEAVIIQQVFAERLCGLAELPFNLKPLSLFKPGFTIVLDIAPVFGKQLRDAIDPVMADDVTG